MRIACADALRNYKTGEVTRVLIETHSNRVALIGSSRGGMTIRNYLLHGGSQNVAFAITCGTPNHGVMAMDANLDAEFNGKGRYLGGLNHAYGDGSEVPPGVKMMTLRSDTLDKYAQPTGVSFGKPDLATGVDYDGPALAGASNVILPHLDHRELAFDPRALAEMYRFITGAAPRTTEVTPMPAPSLSGLVTGFENGSFTNEPLAGVHLRIYAVGKTESSTPLYDVVTASDGKWGPLQASPTQEYDFDMEYQGRHVRLYKAAMPRSTTLLNLRFLAAPKGSGAHGRQLGNLEVLSDTQGVDFGPYLQRILQEVREHWYQAIPESAEMKKGKLSIEFAITKDGQVAGMKLVASSSDTALDRAAWQRPASG